MASNRAPEESRPEIRARPQCLRKSVITNRSADASFCSCKRKKKKFPMRGSNPRLKRERLQCYHYTNRLTYILLKFLPSIFSSPFLLRLSSLSFFHSSNKEKSKSFYVLIK